MNDHTEHQQRAADFPKVPDFPQGIDLSQDLSVAALRTCAIRCRDFAARQPDPQRAELFRGLAASFEHNAALKARRLTAGAI